MDYILCICKLFVVTTNLHFGHYCECIHILLAKIRHVKKRLNGCQFDKGQNKPCRSGGQFTIKSSMKYKCLGDAWYSNRCDPSASRAQHCCQIRMYLAIAAWQCSILDLTVMNGVHWWRQPDSEQRQPGLQPLHLSPHAFFHHY